MTAAEPLVGDPAVEIEPMGTFHLIAHLLDFAAVRLKKTFLFGQVFVSVSESNAPFEGSQPRSLFCVYSSLATRYCGWLVEFT